jgi:hypothetical protein
MRFSLSVRDTCRLIAHVYVEQARFLLIVAVLLFVPIGLVEALVGPLIELETEENLSAWQVVGLLFGVVFHVAVASGGEVFYAGVAMAAVTQAMEGKQRSSLGRLLRTIPYGPLILVDLISALGLGVGLALLIVPGVLLFARYVLAAPLLKIEGLGVWDAFRRSRELSRGHRWFILLLLGSLFLVTDVMTSVLQGGAFELLGHTLLSDWAIAVVVGVVVTPVWAVGLCVVTWRLLHHERQTLRPPVPAP